MRRFNAAATLRVFVRTDAALTSAELVERTGLSRRTVELIVADLMNEGWVRDITPPQTVSRAGRPKKYFELVPERALLLSVIIDDETARAAVSDIRGRVLGRATRRSDATLSASQQLQGAIDAADSALADCGSDASRLGAVVVGIGGTVDQDGVLLTSPAGPDWMGLDIRTPFVNQFATKVAVENSTNLVALAEQWSGAARGVSTFVLLTPGNRVAAGVVIGGEIHRGFEGAAGELVRIEALDLGRWKDHPVGMVSSPEPELRANAHALIVRAGMGDGEALVAVEEFFHSVARLIGVVGWMLAPPVIVLGGAFRGIEQLTLGFVSEALDTVDAPNVEVRIAEHGEDAALIGGLRLSLDLAEAELFGPSAI